MYVAELAHVGFLLAVSCPCGELLLCNYNGAEDQSVIVELYDRVIADSCSVGKKLDHRICPGGTLCLAWMCAGLPTSQTKAVGSGRRAAKIKEIGCIRVDAWRTNPFCLGHSAGREASFGLDGNCSSA